MRDPLTGMLTRLTLKYSLLQEMTRNKRHRYNCCIAIINQNKFKYINDEWGHHIEDRVFVTTA